MLEHSICMELVEVLNILLQRPHHLRKLSQFIAGHFIDHKFSAFLIHDGLCGVDQQLQSIHEVRRQIGIIRIQSVNTLVRSQGCLQAIQSLHKLLVGLGCIATTQLLLTGKVDAGKERNH